MSIYIDLFFCFFLTNTIYEFEGFTRVETHKNRNEPIECRLVSDHFISNPVYFQIPTTNFSRTKYCVYEKILRAKLKIYIFVMVNLKKKTEQSRNVNIVYELHKFILNKYWNYLRMY